MDFALTEKGLTAVAKLAIRNKERLCALRAMDGTLMLETLHYPDEIRVERGVPMPDVAISDQEMQMASALIDLLTKDFEPEQYEDNYREALMELIRAKLEGQEIVDLFKEVDTDPDHPYLQTTLDRDTAVTNESQALVEVYRRLRPGEPVAAAVRHQWPSPVTPPAGRGRSRPGCAARSGAETSIFPPCWGR